MIDNARARLVRALNDPAEIAELGPADWSALAAAARGANLLGLLAERSGAVPVPPAVRRHLDATLQLSSRQTRSVRWEIHRLQRALEPLRIPVVLLKGAAYAVAEHAISRGRIFGDIDILVPREAIGDVELRLMVAGWTSANVDAYDQRYYRRWMHELPPMVNLRRGTVLDVHHTILPLTSRHAPDVSCILRDADPLPDLPMIRVPRPHHLLIHSIVHLLQDGELHNGLRDLFDIDGLVREFGDERFWAKLVDASEELGLARLVHFGLGLSNRIVGTSVPANVFATLEMPKDGGRAAGWLELLYRHALLAETGERKALLPQVAAFTIYVRSHWLRMPPHLLMRHLARKALLRFQKEEPALAERV